MKQSAIIIGGGLGGLFTGAILSKEGVDVTVVEKNVIIGGGLQSFSRFGEIYDTGMHIIGGMQEGGNIRRICEYLGIWPRVRVADVDPDNTDTVFFSEDKKTYHIAQGKKAYIEALSKSFPDQRKNLEEYIDAMYKVAGEVNLFHLRKSTDYFQMHSDDFLMPATDFIAKYISDEHLRSVVSYLNPLFGGRGGVTPAYIHSLISVLYIDGASRFVGGSVNFANTLRDFIVEQGGKVIAGDPVISVHSEEKIITGVTTRNGLNLSADIYICAIHPCTFFTLLDDPTVLPKVYRKRLDEIPNACSAFTLNIKLKPETFEYFNHTVYYMSKYEDIWSCGEAGEWPKGFLYMTPPEENQGKYSTKMIITAPMAWDYVREWEDTTVGHRGEKYDKWKEECAEKLLDCMEEIKPGFRSCIEAVNTASPLTIRDFYGVKEGSMCGYSKDSNNLLFSQVPVVTKVPNLFLTGQNCNLHGFCGVALTAISTSEAILGRNYVLDKINRFDDIRPYYDSEIPDAMQRIASDPAFDKVVSFSFPEKDKDVLREQVKQISSSTEFQKRIMYPAVDNIISKTCKDFTCDGMENIAIGTPYLYMSNHRDIMLDAALMSFTLMKNNIESPEVTFGANLMKGDFVIDVGKANKMFRVERPGTGKMEFYRSSEHLSDYMRSALLQKGHSLWIAQRNGRTKDGCDRTDQGIIRMFLMSDRHNPVQSISELNILPVSISYEWEPCDIKKVIELYLTSLGPYTKKPGEDLESIISGVLQSKGGVHLHFCSRLTASDLQPLTGSPTNVFCKKVAALIDERICREYRLWPNNYIAHDLLTGTGEYSDKYDDDQKDAFIERMNLLEEYLDGYDVRILKDIFLGIYANPVDSMLKFR